MTALDETIDITVKRVVKKQVGNCESSEEYDYIGKAILRNHSLSLDENPSLLILLYHHNIGIALHICQILQSCRLLEGQF